MQENDTIITLCAREKEVPYKSHMYRDLYQFYLEIMSEEYSPTSYCNFAKKLNIDVTALEDLIKNYSEVIQY